MNTRSAINAYNQVGLESGVLASDPHKLILMLYQGALLAIATAKTQMQRKEIAAKGASISKAIAIIDEGLKSSLNMEAGGELAGNLAALYGYMCQRLLLANLNNDPAMLDEVSRLLNDLKGAWEAIRPIVTGIAPPAATPLPVAPEPGNARPPQSTTGKQAALMYGRM
ncbi:MAG TPA: flagellar export chaperone FliS [Gallionellaceae bacterium]|nr:flagellar export chaperone FliS [Gallionellaceae bacterium]